MSESLSFESLLARLRQASNGLPDQRTGKNTQYTIQDAVLGAFSVFYMQSPSFLAHQKHLAKARGQSNAQTLFGLHRIPSDNQIRNLLDPIDPEHLFGVFDAAYQTVAQTDLLAAFEVLDGQLLIPLDGTQYFSSKCIHCENCSSKTHRDGSVTYAHKVIAPVVVSPSQKDVIPLQPEFITPQDGAKKQDSEQAAGKRWLARNAAKFERPLTFLGDDLYCKQPFCQDVLHRGHHFIFVCKPASHKVMYEEVALLEKAGRVQQVSRRHWTGTTHETYTYRYVNQVALRDGADALEVNGCELTIQKADGRVRYKNAFATDHPIDDENVEELVQAGRARWKVENEHHNVLKNQGYHLAHNFGHGKHHLSAFLLTLNLLAFLFHTLLDRVDALYQTVRQGLGARTTFFNDLRALTRYLVFDSWHHLMEFMIEQGKLDSS